MNNKENTEYDSFLPVWYGAESAVEPSFEGGIVVDESV